MLITLILINLNIVIWYMKRCSVACATQAAMQNPAFRHAFHVYVKARNAQVLA